MLAALLFMTVLSLVAVTVLRRTMNTYRHVSHIATWQEALLAAEAGSDTAMVELRKTLTDPTNAFAGWTTTSPDGLPLLNQAKTYSPAQLTHGGEGNTLLNMKVTLDAPPELHDGSERQWYRIRSTGTTYLPGPRQLSGDKRDHLLRRLSFVWNRKTNAQVIRPEATRLVELVVKPTSFENAVVSDLRMSLNNYKIVVDSYDSRFADKSTNGLYDPAKMLENGDIATNSQLIDAGDAHIYGDAYTNDGIIANGANITGEQRTDFYQDLQPITKPSWTTLTAGGPTSIRGSATLAGGTKAAPTRYKLSRLAIQGTEVVTFAPVTPGVESYAEVWITGDLTAAGSGTIAIQPNMNVKIFLEGNIDIKGNGTFNANSQPGRLQILAVKPSNGSTRTMNFSGNGVIVAAIYGPNHDVTFGATGSAGTFWGSLTGRTITMGGTTYIHYDEALADTGHITDFKIQNWFEDNL